MILTNDIYEYDVAHAGISILYEAGAIKKERYDFLCKLEKRKRVVQTGLMIKENPEFSKIIKEGYKKYTDLLIEKNKLIPDNIVELVNDAVWISGASPTVLEFGEVKFRKKQHFHITYIYEKRNIRFYYNFTTDELVCRGGKINKVSKMYKLLKRIFKLYDSGDKEKLYNTLHQTLNKLKKDPDAFGSAITNTLENRPLVRALVKDLINF